MPAPAVLVAIMLIATSRRETRQHHAVTNYFMNFINQVRMSAASMNIVIYHNPDCGTSRNVLQTIRACGYEPTVIEYLETGWTREQLLGLFAAASLSPRTALRETKSPAKDLGLLEDNVSDEAILSAMLDNPILVNRPIVCCHRGVRLCRPSETVLTLLDNIPDIPLYKEDGELMIVPPK